MNLNLDEIIKVIPRPVLVIGILVISLALFVYNSPLKDECEIQGSIFTKNMQGILYVEKINKKKQFPQINYWRERCKEGNSIGSCDAYFEGLRVLTKELREVNDKCQKTYTENDANLIKHVYQALQIMALVAWGEKPPGGPSERIGWMTTANIKTFCYLKKTFILLAGEEQYLALREKVYLEYPDNWPEKLEVEKRTGENRPRAYKTPQNPVGTLTKDKIYERSLFSIKCDLYL